MEPPGISRFSTRMTLYLAPGCYEGGAGCAMNKIGRAHVCKIIYSTSVTDLIKDESGRVPDTGWKRRTG